MVLGKLAITICLVFFGPDVCEKETTTDRPSTVPPTPGPTNVSSMPCPMNVSSMPCPTNVSSMPCPTNVSSMPCPMNVSSMPCPMNVSSMPCPTNVSSMPCPTNVSSMPCPTNVSSMPCPTNVSSMPCPTNVSSMPCPTNVSSMPCPTNVSSTPRPRTFSPTPRPRTVPPTTPDSSPGSYRTVQTFVNEMKTYTSRSTPSKTFMDVAADIEVGVAQARIAGPRVRYSKKKITTIKSTITLAVDKRMYQFARQRLGQALFLIKDHNSKRTSRKKRSTAPDTSSFIRDLKTSLGDDKFDKLMAVEGDVTLMFAIDTTGSMSDEIEAAKRIAIDVVNYPREFPVSYILAPFSDPEIGEVTFKDEENAAGFIKAISKLTASGGGDCPELAITAILNAIEEGPEPNSPLYVFTDASAKDATDKRIRDIISLANMLGVTINFYTTGGLCGKSIVDHPYSKLAEATSGQLLRLKSSGEIGRLNGLTRSGLESGIVTSGSSRATRKKRSAGGNRYFIKVDDSAKSISISITTDNSDKGPFISLRDPKGVKVTSGKVSMSKVTVYELTSPRVGVWTLFIPVSVGPYTFFARSHGDKNIDFKYFFLALSRRKPYEVPAIDPLIGQQTKVVIMLAGADKIRKETVQLELIAKHGGHIRNVALTPNGEGSRYTATFTSPSRPFKLKIKGTTKSGNPFERISRGVEEPKSIQLRILYSGDEFTLKRGEVSTVTFRLYNAARVNKLINIEVRDTLGYAAIPRRNRRTLRKGRRAFFRIEFTTPSSAVVGAKDTALVSLSVNNGAERVSLPVQLLVAE